MRDWDTVDHLRLPECFVRVASKDRGETAETLRDLAIRVQPEMGKKDGGRRLAGGLVKNSSSAAVGLKKRQPKIFSHPLPVRYCGTNSARIRTGTPLRSTVRERANAGSRLRKSIRFEHTRGICNLRARARKAPCR